MNRIKELESAIVKHKSLYYQGRAVISDREYDLLEDELKKLSPDNPVLSIVGTVVKGKKKIKHDTKMLSLNKTYKLDELLNWKGEQSILSTFKIDGTSCSLIYDHDGNLVTGKTRGDGSFGEDITDKVLWIANIPKKISIGPCEVRGEVFCRESSFIRLSEEMNDLGLERPSSQRNIVAGLMGRKENIDLARHLEFFAFELLGSSIKLEKEEEKFHKLDNLGFDIPPFETHKLEKTIEKFINETEVFIANGDYLIDGIVFSFNELKLHQEMGSTAHHPRYKMAFKFQGVSKETEIKSITWQVSRNGILTPVAEVKEVELSGAKINRVTLHNFGVVKTYNLKADDKIEIVRSGEVIPKFLSVIKSSNSKFKYPSVCPSCGEKVFEEDIRIICKNPKCPAQVQQNILYFVQKIGIEDLSIKRLEEMLKIGLISEIPDLYELKIKDLMTLDKTKEKLATKIFENIQNSKSADLITFLSSLGIVGGAYNKCEKIVRAGFDTIEDFFELTVEKLVSVDSFAEKSATDFLTSFKTKIPLVKSLLKVGFNFEVEEIETSEITGLKFVITGTLSRKRGDIEKDIKKLGGEVIKAVSSNTDFLVSNDKDSSSSKAKKARSLNIPIISEEKLYQMMGLS